jgi:hypothetical protein
MVLRNPPPPRHPMRSTDFWPRRAPPAAIPPWPSTSPASSTAATRIGCRRVLPPRRCRRRPVCETAHINLAAWIPNVFCWAAITLEPGYQRQRLADAGPRGALVSSRPSMSTAHAAGVKSELLRIFRPQSGVRSPLRPRRRRKLQGAVAALQAAKAGQQHASCALPLLCPPSAHSRSSWPLRTNC